MDRKKLKPLINQYFAETIIPTTHKQKETALNRFIGELKSSNWSGELYLVGSFVTGDDNEYSDVDVVVNTRPELLTPHMVSDMKHIQKRILHNFGVLIDTLHYRSKHPVHIFLNTTSPHRLLLIKNNIEINEIKNGSVMWNGTTISTNHNPVFDFIN